MSKKRHINGQSRRAVLYLRMSKDSQDESIPSQRKALQGLAKDNSYQLVGEYDDRGRRSPSHAPASWHHQCPSA